MLVGITPAGFEKFFFAIGQAAVPGEEAPPLGPEEMARTLDLACDSVWKYTFQPSRKPGRLITTAADQDFQADPVLYWLVVVRSRGSPAQAVPEVGDRFGDEDVRTEAARQDERLLTGRSWAGPQRSARLQMSRYARISWSGR